MTQLSALLSPGLFAQQVWSGWVGNPEELNADFWFQVAAPVNVDAKELEKELGAFQTSVARDRNIEDRFTLMSKLFARALAIPPGEERFLWLWTVLEVFPMQDTTNIKPMMDYLSRVTGHALLEVKSKLDIGHSLYGARCKLVHDGKLPYSREELGKVLGKLEAIVLTVLRDVGGLPYRGHLDKYFS